MINPYRITFDQNATQYSLNFSDFLLNPRWELLLTIIFSLGLNLYVFIWPPEINYIERQGFGFFLIPFNFILIYQCGKKSKDISNYINTYIQLRNAWNALPEDIKNTDSEWDLYELKKLNELNSWEVQIKKMCELYPINKNLRKEISSFFHQVTAILIIMFIFVIVVYTQYYLNLYEMTL